MLKKRLEDNTILCLQSNLMCEDLAIYSVVQKSVNDENSQSLVDSAEEYFATQCDEENAKNAELLDNMIRTLSSNSHELNAFDE